MSPDLLELRLDELSNRIKAAREARGMTLAELSGRSTVASSTILKIEARQMVPSVAVIMKIAAGLDMSITDLIAPAEIEPVDVVQQSRGDHGRLQMSPDFFYEQLSSEKLGTGLHFWRVSIKGSGKIVFSRPHAFEEQIAVCEAGAIEMNLDGETFTLSKGDSIHVVNRSLVSLRNLVKTPSSYLATGLLVRKGALSATLRA